MNGPDHYVQAELEIEAGNIPEALAHATLALTAAFVSPTAYDNHQELVAGWLEVIR